MSNNVKELTPIEFKDLVWADIRGEKIPELRQPDVLVYWRLQLIENLQQLKKSTANIKGTLSATQSLETIASASKSLASTNRLRTKVETRITEVNQLIKELNITNVLERAGKPPTVALDQIEAQKSRLVKMHAARYNILQTAAQEAIKALENRQTEEALRLLQEAIQKSKRYQLD